MARPSGGANNMHPLSCGGGEAHKVAIEHIWFVFRHLADELGKFRYGEFRLDKIGKVWKKYRFE